MKYIQRTDSDLPMLVVLDGHKSQINLPVLEWARRTNVTIIVLPAHTSDVLRLLDVGCFGPLQKINNANCHRFIRQNSASIITWYNVSSLASDSYITAMSCAYLRSAFQKTGIFPFNDSAVSAGQFLPYLTVHQQLKTNLSHIVKKSY